MYNPKVNLVNDNLYTKFGRNKSIRSQDIEQKLNSDVNQGPLFCCKLGVEDVLKPPGSMCCRPF